MTNTALIHRHACACCGGKALSPVATTPPIPAFQGCTEAPASEDMAAPQTWALCATCGSVMLMAMMPLEVIYMAAHATSLGAIWDEHHNLFAAFVAKHGGQDILEVGGGVGKLAHYFRQTGHSAPWTILEANPLPPETPIADLQVKKGLLGPETDMGGHDTLVFSHCLEHILDIGAMVATIAAKLPEGGRHIVAWPQIEAWLPQALPGALNWEHTFYIPIATLITLHARHGLKLVEHVTFKDHSHFLAFEKAAPADQPWDEASAPSNGEAVAAYWRLFSTRVKALNTLLATSPAPHYVMPASVYSQYLLAFRLDATHLHGVLDNAPVKQGKRLYGTNLTVFPASQAAGGTPTVIINGGSHTASIVEGLKAVNPEVVCVDVRDYV